MKKNLTGFIMAGGKSSRMGTDKGLLLLDEKRMVEHIIEVLKPVVDEVVIISNSNSYDYLGYRVMEDLVKETGPMGGIYTALLSSLTDKNIVVACDMPFLSTELIKHLIDNYDGHEITLPQFNNQLEPLCAIYRKGAISKFEELLNLGNFKLKDALQNFTVRTITIQSENFGNDCFKNINTPVEYQEIKSNYSEYKN